MAYLVVALTSMPTPPSILSRQERKAHNYFFFLFAKIIGKKVSQDGCCSRSSFRGRKIEGGGASGQGGDSLGGEGSDSGRRAGAGQRHERVPQQFVSAPVQTPVGAGGASGRHGEIWAWF